MCLTKPFQVKEIAKGKAKVFDGKNLRQVNIALIPNLKAGDWVLVNANLAIQKIFKKEAKEILKMFKK